MFSEIPRCPADIRAEKQYTPMPPSANRQVAASVTKQSEKSVIKSSCFAPFLHPCNSGNSTYGYKPENGVKLLLKYYVLT